MFNAGLQPDGDPFVQLLAGVSYSGVGRQIVYRILGLGIYGIPLGKLVDARPVKGQLHVRPMARRVKQDCSFPPLFGADTQFENITFLNRTEDDIFPPGPDGDARAKASSSAPKWYDTQQQSPILMTNTMASPRLSHPEGIPAGKSWFNVMLRSINNRLLAQPGGERFLHGLTRLPGANLQPLLSFRGCIG